MWNIYQPGASYRNRKTQEGERPMIRLSLAILGTAAILTSGFAGTAIAKGTMTKGAKDKQVTQAKSQSHMQRRAADRSERFRDANAVVSRDQYGRPMGPVGAAGAVVGGAVATAGAIATAPFRAFDNSFNTYDNSYANYHGYGYGGRDWKTYAARNGLACTPGTTFRGADGQQRLCQ
jgi:hypothetical protein